MSAYPRPFDHGDFPAVPPMTSPPVRAASDLSAKASTHVRNAVRVPGDAYITQLCIQDSPEALPPSPSFQNKRLGSNPSPDATHFNFIPGVDDVKIRWKVRRPAKVVRATFELRSFTNGGAVIWTSQYQDAAAVQLIAGPQHDGEGSLAWDQVVIPGGDPRFPDSVPNVANAPYQLSLTIESQTGMITTAWTYFDVMVHSVELHWGDTGMIPAGDIGGVISDPWQTLTRRDEPALLNGLRQPPGGPMNTAISAHGEIPLPLPSTNAAYTYFHEWSKGRDFGFLRHKLRWGTGPRLPILAKVFLLRMNGDGIHSDDAAKALGPAEFLWNWRDRTMAERDAAEHVGLQPEVANYIRAALRFQVGTPNEPPDCLNCHTLRGGKRGGTVRVLRETSGTDNFPFQVRAAATRKWAAISKAHSNGPHACWTGVLFQPSRMALDSYKIRVFLATPAYLPTLDVAVGRSRRLVRNHPGLPTATTGMFVVKRRIDARYIRKSALTPAMNLANIDACFAVGGLHVVWQSQFWTRAEFQQCFDDAIAPDNAGEAHGWARNSVFDTPAILRRRGITNGNPARLPLTIARLQQYDQWSGLPVAVATPLSPPNDANFAVPGRDIIDKPIIAAAVQRFLTKGFELANETHRWNNFLGLNPGLPANEAEVQFYQNGMNLAERNAVRQEIENIYNDPANQLREFDALPGEPLKWIEANYQYSHVGFMKIVIEMHVRKLMADQFEGVTFFHYAHLLEPKTAAGGVMGRQVSIGGFAGIELSRDLGLDAAFLAWGHPTDNSRRDLKRLWAQYRNDPVGMNCELKNGELTAAHEFGHFLHLPHRDGGGADGVVNAGHYRGDDPNFRCLMDYDPNGTFLCGVCAMRVRGWAWRAESGLHGLGNDIPIVDQGVPSDAPDNDTRAAFTAVYNGSPLA